jgi:predicted DsbA family dithiol-disulfide isomerase
MTAPADTGATARVVRVEMVADVVCPFCHIGLNRLQLAVDRAAKLGLGLEVEISYTPFILRRHLPKEGIEKLEVFRQQHGSDAHGLRVLDNIRQAAAADGLRFDLAGQRAGNSEDAHRLLLWARSQGKEMVLFETLMRAYNCERGWLGDHEVLARCAAQAGLDDAQAREFLQDEKRGLEELNQSLRRSDSLGVSGVPYFVVDGKREVSGAAPPEQFIEIFKDATSGRV